LPNVTIQVNAQTTEISPALVARSTACVTNQASGEEHGQLACSVQIGLVPNTRSGSRARWTSRLVEVDAKGPTSLPGVFAASDCTGAVQADRDCGRRRLKALSAFDYLIRQPVPSAVPAETPEAVAYRSLPAHGAAKGR
jgi:alkyl hydroperoxide reductase subunit F